MKLTVQLCALIVLFAPVLSVERKYKTVSKPSRVYRRLHKFKGVEVQYPKIPQKKVISIPRKSQEETFAPKPPTMAPAKSPKSSKSTKAPSKSTKSTKAPKTEKTSQAMFELTSNGIGNDSKVFAALAVGVSVMASLLMLD